MIIAYFQQYIPELLNENMICSGFICPYSKENCMHVDSLSMTRTVNCNDCGITSSEKKAQNSLNINDLILNTN